MTRLMMAAVMACVPIGLGGCQERAPAGQVVASVDGDDVTKRDIAFEAAVTGVPPGPSAVAAVIDRKLLAHRAEAEKLDRTPEYLAAIRRFREATLASMLVRAAVNEGRHPTTEQVGRFVRAHPATFARRAAVLVEQEGGKRWLDTATLADAQVAERLITTPPGGRTMLDGRPAVIRQRVAIAMSPAQVESTARTLMDRQASEATTRRLLEGEHRSARIRYQPGFGQP